MSSTLQIQFTGTQISENDKLNVSVTTPSSTISLVETFKLLRTSNYQVTIGDGSVTPIENVYAENYAIAWNFDYSQVGGTNNLVAVSSGDTVTITLLNPSWQFNLVAGGVILLGKANFTINNATLQEPSSVTLTSYSEDSSDRCGKCFANFSVTGGNNSYNVYEGATLLASAQSSPISVNFDRGYSTKLQFLDTTGQLIDKTSIITPRRLISNDISVDITNLSSGASLNISTPFIHEDINPYQYSLDDVTYQVSNLFTGIANGTYTIYVKDDFGCVTSKTGVVVDGATQTSDLNFFLSEINPIRFFQLDNEKKNYYNTISCGELKSIAYPFFQKYLSTDSILTQFKTNCPYINCFTLDSDENTSTLVEVQQTANTGLRAKSTCTYFNLGDGRSAVYFGVVDLLDYDTDAFVETVDFGFSLPEWANKQGDYVVIENIGEVQISAVGYSETYEAFILEFDIAYTGSPVERKISALYSLNPYEVYEVSTDMSTTPSKFNIVIECGVDANNINFTYISETIEIVEDDDFLLRIDYWDNENKGGIVYQTGIKNRIRMFGKMNYMGDQETEGYNGDQEYFVTDNVIYNSSELIINRLTSAMAHKMRLVLSHSELYINGIRSKLYESPEISGDENNNFKQFKALVKQSGNEFLTDAQEQITSEGGALSAAIEAAQDKSFLLWTKNL
jgi:hypothetical protein